MTVVRARRDELRECQLVQRARPFDVPLGRHDLRDQFLGQHHPGEPETRRQRLARRAEVHHPLRIEALQSAHRLTVVSELPVVVVLQDQPAGGARPVDSRHAPVRAQLDPGRVLVRRCHQYRADSVQSRQIVSARATFVDVEGRDTQAGARQQVAIDVEAIRLDGHRPYPPRPECLRHQHQTVVETGADDDPLRLGVHPAGPRQIVREDGAQFYPAEGVAVAEGVVRRRGQGASGRGEPLRAGKLREVR